MIDFLSKIKGSASVIKSAFPKSFKADISLIKEVNHLHHDGVKVVSELKYSEIPHFEITTGNKTGSVQFCRIGSKDLIVFNGRQHYYDGIGMRNIAHKIYVMKHLGIKKIIAVDEVGQLNPRFNCGELALIYDHINLMGDNPLIGKNEDSLGVRFPDMSNAYDAKLFGKVVSVLRDCKVKINEAVYMGITGPNSETEAEARFYREAGCDVVGYSLVPENITAVHTGLKFVGIGLITRELVADKMMEDARSDIELSTEIKKFRQASLKQLSAIFQRIIEAV